MIVTKDFGNYLELRVAQQHKVLLNTTDYIRLLYLGVTSISPCVSKTRGCSGYTITVDNCRQRLHRFITTCPVYLQVDHINRDVSDNRQENLRCVTHRENHKNRNNNRRLIGAYPYKKRWRSFISVRGKSVALGIFSTEQEAHAAYTKAELNLSLKA